MKAKFFTSILIVFLVGCNQANEVVEDEIIETNTPQLATITPSLEPTVFTPTQTIEPASAPRPEYFTLIENDSEWQAYQSHAFRYSIMLPPEWAVIDLIAEDFAELAARVETEHPILTSMYTSDDFRNLYASGVRMISIETDEGYISTSVPAKLDIYVQYMPVDLTLTEYIDLNINQLTSIFGEEVVITQEVSYLGEFEAGKLSYEIQISKPGEPPITVIYTHYLSLKGRTQYVLSTVVPKDRADNYVELFDSIRTSFVAANLFVDPEGTDYFCDSWEHACSLETALAIAKYGDEIWVKKGVHYPSDNVEQLDTAFKLRDGVAIYGGFNGTEKSLDERNWEINITVLSGDVERNDITDSDGVVTDTKNIVGQNSYHVVYASGTSNTAILDGFVITAGYANKTPPDIHGYGGGLFSQAGSPTLNNLIFSANTAGNGRTYHGGGGMFNSFNSNPVLTNVTFIANTAGSGAGIYNDKSSPILNNVKFINNKAIDASCINNYLHSSPIFHNVSFENNISSNKGCVVNHENSNPEFYDVIFDSNSATYGAGMYNYQSSPILKNVIFLNNKAGHVGGAMENEDHSNPRITNVLFSGNTAKHQGGAMINMIQSNPLIVNSTFVKNGVTGDAGGGAIMNSNGSLTLINVTFSGNYAVVGGAIDNWQEELILINVTLLGNTATMYGSAIYSQESEIMISNSIIWGNRPTDSQLLTNSGKETVDYSIIYGGRSGIGNLNRNPQLGSLTEFGKYSIAYLLKAGSPAIDAGSLESCPENDQQGNLRPVDGNGDGVIGCDIGAIEFQIED